MADISFADDIGKVCSLATCRRRDFLPIRCTHCKLFYCTKHHRAVEHHCEHYDPKGRRLPVAKGSIYRHACTMPHCTRKEMVEVVCLSCRRNFCFRHRMPEYHRCIKV